jgi:hypothetical protein
MHTVDQLKPLEDGIFTSAELAQKIRLHPETIRKLFWDEPGVIRLGRRGDRHRRRYYTLRIPAAVAARVLARLTVVPATRYAPIPDPVTAQSGSA